ncbi:MAG: type II toxin-antitoxin system RelE/ParE family toxin [Bacteroidota bacterium]
MAPDFAPLFVSGAFSAAARLSSFPRAGRTVPEISDPSIREILYRQYRIIYVIVDDTAEVLTVYHSARQFGGLQ